MLPRAPHVETVFNNPDTGFLSGLTQPGSLKLFLECSSIDVAASTALAGRVHSKQHGVFVDAPVSGGPQGSDAGKLTFMVGSPSSEAFDLVKPILRMMGKEENIYHCGGQGAGLATKQLNNYLGYVGYIGLCEIMNAGLLYGLDPKVLSSKSANI
jgi:3-hydroxyisobutyrate/3-hydroxypropionate dehydrogenase